ncbi:MAG: hypothetical protein ACLPY2_00770, partial [Bryobacteraceae bacterium]
MLRRFPFPTHARTRSRGWASPGSESWTQKEAEYTVGNTGLKAVRNVVNPSITVYLPPAETAT